MRLMGPCIIRCGWCGTSNRRDEKGSCVSCGGHLPPAPHGDAGPEPPRPPRALPSGYTWRVMVWQNVFVLIGAICTVALSWTVIFPLVGIPLWIYGHRKARRQLKALIAGDSVRGKLTVIETDYSQVINGRHPWRLKFEYETPDGTRPGTTTAWDEVHGERKPGEELWVVYVPGEPGVHSIWPPLK